MSVSVLALAGCRPEGSSSASACGAVYDQVCPSASLSTFGISVGREPTSQGVAYAAGEGREDAFGATPADARLDWHVATAGSGGSLNPSAASVDAPAVEARSADSKTAETRSIEARSIEARSIEARSFDAKPFEPKSIETTASIAPAPSSGEPIRLALAVPRLGGPTAVAAPGTPIPVARPYLQGDETAPLALDGDATPASAPVPAPNAPVPAPRPADAADGSASPVPPVGAAAQASPAIPLPVPPRSYDEPLPGVSIPGSPLSTASISPAPAPAPELPAKAMESRARERVDQLDRRGGRSRSLSEVVARAVASSPEIGAAGASAAQAKAGIGIAKSALYPVLDTTIATGHGTYGNYTQSQTVDYFSQKYASGSWRSDGFITGRQLVYDWGATDKDIERAEALARSQNLKTRAIIEDVAFRAANSYLQIQQQRDLVKLAHENFISMRELSRLVELNQNNGNGTLADVKRVRARVLDAETQVADAEAELLNAIDRFRRLTRTEPGELKPMPTFRRQIPPTKEQALAQAVRQSPRILSLSAASDAARAEVVSTRATGLPKIQLEASLNTKELRSRANSTEVDARGFLSLRYNLMDGGLLASQVEQALQRQVESDMKQQSERDGVEADLRQFYRTLSTAQAKASSLAASADANGKAREVYGQQFQSGKRTLLELLEVQTAYFTSKRALILNAYEERRAANGVLLAIGHFAETALAARN